MITRLHTPEQASSWLRARVTGSLSVDSRTVGDGDGFIAWPGAATDGRRYVEGVLAAPPRANASAEPERSALAKPSPITLPFLS